MSGRTMARHGLSLAVTLGVLIAMPSLVPVALRGVSKLLGMHSGFHVHDVVVERRPLSVALLVLVGVAGICALGRLARRRWTFLSWAWPAIPGIAAGVWTAFMARGGDMPAAWPAALGLTAGLLTFLLIGSYWYTLFLVPERKQHAAE